MLVTTGFMHNDAVFVQLIPRINQMFLIGTHLQVTGGISEPGNRRTSQILLAYSMNGII